MSTMRLDMCLRASNRSSAGPPLMQCHDACACDPVTCPFRRVSRELGCRHLRVVKRVEELGWGLESRDFIHRGEAVCDYLGELISPQEARRRHETRGSSSGNFILSFRECTLGADNSSGHRRPLVTTIDASVCGSLGRFVNHSCSPNLEVRAVRMGCFIPRLVFFAREDVECGAELTIDYGGTTAVTATEESRAAPPPESAPPGYDPGAKRAAVQDGTGGRAMMQRHEQHQSPSKDDERDHQQRRCLCGSRACRGVLPIDP